MVMGRREEAEERDQRPWRIRRTWAGPSSRWPTQTTTASSGGEREQIISRGRGVFLSGSCGAWGVVNI